MAYVDKRLKDLNVQGGYGNVDQFTEEAAERTLRLQALCRVYEQADRVLSGDPVQVVVVDEGPAPAWSDGASIWLNASEVEDFDLAEMTQINGLNFHELAHHLYTPRRGTELVKWVLNRGYHTAFNLLEDQRIETLLTGRYPAIVPFLTATIVRWLGRDMQSVQLNYVAIRGRRYLPLNIRHAFRDMFVRPDLIPDIARIVDEYRLLAFNRDYKRAQVLIEEFAKLLDDLNQSLPYDVPQIGEMDGGPGSCAQRSPAGKGRPEPSKMQERDADRAKGIGQAETPYERKQGDPGDQTSAQSGDDPADGQGQGDDGQGQQGKSDDGQPGDGSGSNNTGPTKVVEMTRDEAMAERESRVNSAPSKGHGVDHVKSVGGKPTDASIGALKEALTKAISDVHARKDVQADVRTKQRVIIGGDGKFEDNDIKRGTYDLMPANPVVVSAFRRFARELERLKQECEPIWNRQQSSGRLNVQRWMQSCPIDEAFDRWEEGTDGVDIEAVMLIDRSGSMGGGNDVKASESAWVVKRALDHVGADVSVYSFDHKAEIVFDRGKKAHHTQLPFVYGAGGTDPTTSLIAAERIFMSSQRKSKVLFVVTDGDYPESSDEIVRRLNAHGVLTVMVLIMNEDEYDRQAAHARDMEAAGYRSRIASYKHDCQVFRRIDTAGALTQLAREVVTGMIRKALRAS